MYLRLDRASESPTRQWHGSVWLERCMTSLYATLWTLLKTTRLFILLPLLARLFQHRYDNQLHGEEQKVVLHHDRLRAIIKSLVHVLPVSAVLGIVYINLVQYYIGGELAGVKGQDAEKLAALQFAGKLLEILMMASLSVVVLSALRAELVGRQGLPVGTVLAAHQLSSPSTLYSMEYIGSLCWLLKHRTTVSWRHWYLLILIPLCVLLGVSVGPSATVLILPKLDDWPCGGVNFWVNATGNELLTTKIDTTPSIADCQFDAGDPACPYGEYESIMANQVSFYTHLTSDCPVVPESLLLASPHSMRSMRLRHRTIMNDSASCNPDPFTGAAVTSSVLSDGLTENSKLWTLFGFIGGFSSVANVARFGWYRSAISSVSAYEISGRAVCNTFNSSMLNSTSSPELWFPIMSSFQNAAGAPGLMTWKDHRADNVETTTFLQDALFNEKGPSLHWMDLGDDHSTASSLLALVAYPHMQQYLACSFGLWNIPATIGMNAIAPKVVYTDTSDGDSLDQLSAGASWNMTTPSVAWANLTNPFISAYKMDVFKRMTQAAGIWQSEQTILPYHVPMATELILVSMLVNGLARQTYNTTLVGTLIGQRKPGDLRAGGTFADALFPNSSLGYGGDAYELSAAEKETATMFVMHTDCNGWAYSYRGQTQQVSIAILLLYCCIAISHMLFLWISGRSSSAWEHLSELTVLALNSQPSALMARTGAGIEKMRTYEAVVNIRSEQDMVGFVFADTEGDCKMIEHGKKYA